jgi:S1-C subfamily serine protease
VNTQGQVIGMDTAASSSSSNQGNGATLGFALPINTVRTIVTNIEKGVAKNGILLGESPYLGIFEQVSSGPGSGGFNFGNSGNTGNTGSAAVTVPGVVLGGVATGSPADQVGLVAGDVITAINGQKTTTWPALVAIVQKLHPGDTLSLSFTDSTGVPHNVNLKLAGIPR